jgi:hypothetical protein
MDKCWFVLRQTHYPPPTEPESPDERYKGPICLGHIIPDLKSLDQVINTEGPEPYPNIMPVYLTQQWDLTWSEDAHRNRDVSAKAEVPAAGPVDVKADAGIAFKRSVKNYLEFASLDTAIIQPTASYVKRSLETDLVAQHLESRKVMGMSSWSLFMISGLVIAKGAKKGNRSDTHEAGGHGNAGVGVPGVAEAGAKVDISSGGGTTASFQKASDFVWAIRLMKISKGVFNPAWKMSTFVQGATFSLGEAEKEGEADVAEVLSSEGLDPEHETQIFRDNEGDAFVVQEDSAVES